MQLTEKWSGLPVSRRYQRTEGIYIRYTSQVQKTLYSYLSVGFRTKQWIALSSSQYQTSFIVSSDDLFGNLKSIQQCCKSHGAFLHTLTYMLNHPFSLPTGGAQVEWACDVRKGFSALKLELEPGGSNFSSKYYDCLKFIIW